MIDISSAIKLAVAMERMQPPVTFADGELLYDAEQQIAAHGLGPALLALDKAGTLDQTVAASSKVLNDARGMLGIPSQRASLLALMGSL